MKHNVIVDLDGTIALDDHRRHLIPKEGLDAYFAQLHLDTPNHEVIYIMDLLYKQGHRVHILTARVDNVRFETELWLAKHEVPHHALLMRPSDTYKPEATHTNDKENWTPDQDIKLAMLKEANLRPENVLLCLDDRDDMLEFWRGLGYAAWQVRPQGKWY